MQGEEMSFLRITERVKSTANAMLFDLFHTGRLEVGGRTIQLRELVLPVGVREKDHIVWRFPEAVRVATPGPDAWITTVRQYRDRIEFAVRPFADVRIEFE
jgi:hypothetical protein